MNKMQRVLYTEWLSGNGVCAPDGHVYKDSPVTDIEARLLQCLLLNTSKILVYKFNKGSNRN